MSTPSRRVDPLRRELNRDTRQKLLSESEELQREVDSTDALLAELGARRHRLALQIAELRDRLWPRDPRRFGRRPGGDGSVQLPPLPSGSTKLWGRRLRAACLAILRSAGETTLAELHALLHHQGFEVESPHPVKALADALGYETDQGRAHRAARGVYAPAGGA